ncbi:MAG: ABC transporter permease [Pseudomonadota bacterium]
MANIDTQSEEPAELRQVRIRFASVRAIFALILREMSTSYGRSPGGYVWAILEPAAGIALLTAIFSAGFRTPPLGTNFPLFYATGVLPFLMYMDITGKMAQTLSFSKALLEYPRVTFIDALTARFILNMLTHFMVHFVIMAWIFIFLDVSVIMDVDKILLAYAMTLALAFGLGSLNCFLVLAYPIWQTVWAVINRPMFIISCLFFLWESVPEPWSNYLWFNPLVHITGLMRDAFFPFYNPNYISPIYVFTFAAICAIVGLFLLNRYHRDILDQ